MAQQDHLRAFPRALPFASPGAPRPGPSLSRHGNPVPLPSPPAGAVVPARRRAFGAAGVRRAARGRRRRRAPSPVDALPGGGSALSGRREETRAPRRGARHEGGDKDQSPAAVEESPPHGVAPEVGEVIRVGHVYRDGTGAVSGLSTGVVRAALPPRPGVGCEVS